MSTTMPEAQYLHIEVSFPHGVYSGASRGTAEAYPSGARLYDALIAAAGSGPAAVADGDILVASPPQQAALEWLESNELRAVVVPRQVQVRQSAQRFRWRASPATLDQTPFEPLSAVDGPVTFLWDPPSDEIVSSLREIAAEVESVGRAESLATVSVFVGTASEDDRTLLTPAVGRGPGVVMPVPRPGRHNAMVSRYRAQRQRGSHNAGSMGKQAADVQPAQCDDALELRRFTQTFDTAAWPYAEVWVCELDGDRNRIQRALDQRAGSVPLAVAWHRAIIRDLSSDVPAFVTGRDGAGPLQGPGHMALHLVDLTGVLHGAVAIPHDIDQVDRARLWNQLVRGVDVHWGAGRAALRFRVHAPQSRPASTFWSAQTDRYKTAVPLVVDVPGSPRKGPWSLHDAVVHTLANAFRGTLEATGLAWGTGWAFRQEVVATLRDEFGVQVHAVHRRRDSASRFVHRAASNDLVVAVDADLSLGSLVPLGSSGFVAIGRARHLGGGLLVPVEDNS